MNALNQLQRSGQSTCLDNIRRRRLTGGTLQRYIRDPSVTGLTPNPTFFERVTIGSDDHDATIQNRLNTTKTEEALRLELALEGLAATADLLRP